MRAFLACLIAAILAGPTSSALAQGKPKTLGNYEAWNAYQQGDGKNKICFAVSRPTESLPKEAKRGEIYVMVSHRPAEKVQNEINVAVGYPLKKDVPVEAEIGRVKFPLTVFDEKDFEEHAFAPSPEKDRALADQIAKGDKLVVRGTSQRGTATTDTYSLKGASAALKAITEACK